MARDDEDRLLPSFHGEWNLRRHQDLTTTTHEILLSTAADPPSVLEDLPDTENLNEILRSVPEMSREELLALQSQLEEHIDEQTQELEKKMQQMHFSESLLGDEVLVMKRHDNPTIRQYKNDATKSVVDKKSSTADMDPPKTLRDAVEQDWDKIRADPDYAKKRENYLQQQREAESAARVLAMKKRKHAKAKRRNGNVIVDTQ